MLEQSYLSCLFFLVDILIHWAFFLSYFFLLVEIYSVNSFGNYFLLLFCVINLFEKLKYGLTLLQVYFFLQAPLQTCLLQIQYMPNCFQAKTKTCHKYCKSLLPCHVHFMFTSASQGTTNRNVFFISCSHPKLSY